MNFSEIFSGLLEPVLGTALAKGSNVVGHRQNLFNDPRADDIMSQSVQKVQAPCADHVVDEYEVLLR